MNICSFFSVLNGFFYPASSRFEHSTHLICAVLTKYKRRMTAVSVAVGVFPKRDALERDALMLNLPESSNQAIFEKRCISKKHA